MGEREEEAKMFGVRKSSLKLAQEFAAHTHKQSWHTQHTRSCSVWCCVCCCWVRSVRAPSGEKRAHVSCLAHTQMNSFFLLSSFCVCALANKVQPLTSLCAAGSRKCAHDKIHAYTHTHRVSDLHMCVFVRSSCRVRAKLSLLEHCSVCVVRWPNKFFCSPN